MDWPNGVNAAWLASLDPTDPQTWASLLTLTVMEIVLGIDNLIFIAILAARLPERLQGRARRIGLGLALVLRLALLASITWIMRLTAPVIELYGHGFSWRDIILIAGGAFLIYKGTAEIHERIEGAPRNERPHAARESFLGIVAQIAVIDVVFSIDSVITAVGMANELAIMMAAVVISVGVMMVAAAPVAGFVNRHPTVKMLALSFLLLIGTMLVADGFGMHVSKGYVYAAIGFSALVEGLNQLAARRRAAVAARSGPIA